jgi:hypothetical protein
MPTYCLSIAATRDLLAPGDDHHNLLKKQRQRCPCRNTKTLFNPAANGDYFVLLLPTLQVEQAQEGPFSFFAESSDYGDFFFKFSAAASYSASSLARHSLRSFECPRIVGVLPALQCLSSLRRCLQQCRLPCLFLQVDEQPPTLFWMRKGSLFHVMSSSTP